MLLGKEVRTILKNSKYLRLSITNKCNLSCFYCHREGNYSNQQKELSPDELQLMCQIALDMGFQKFKLTGGEPTLHSDIYGVISRLTELKLPDLSMITNGITLSKQATSLWDAGLRRINVTLNTLRQERFHYIQQNNAHSIETVLQGISKAQDIGFKNIKINFVYFDESSKQDLKELLAFVKEYNCTLVVLPILGTTTNYTLNYLYNILKTYGIEQENVFTDREGISKRLIKMNSGANVILRMDELGKRKPYCFCSDCVDYHKCREGIFPIRVSTDGELIPCMASMNHRIPIRDFLAERNTDGIRQAFFAIQGMYQNYE